MTCLLLRLGHREQKDEWQPRIVEVFQKHNVLPPNAIVSAGSASSACTAGMLQPALVHRPFLLSFNFRLGVIGFCGILLVCMDNNK